MARQSWLLHHERPAIEILLREPFTGFTSRRILLADTGAGSRLNLVEIILSVADTKHYGVLQELEQVGMSGAIQGQYSIYLVDIEIPILNVKRRVKAAGVPPTVFFTGFQGIACFRFLNSFNYGNGGNPAEFSLETI